MTIPRTRLALILGAAGCTAVFLAGAPSSFAATIGVNANSQVSGDNQCSLEEAIASMNQAQNFDACSASGAYGTNDQINIPAGSAYSVNVGLAFSHALIISGADLASTVLTFKTVSGTTSDAMHVISGNPLVIQNLTLKGAATNLDDAIYSKDTPVTLSNVRVTGFSNGAIINLSGTLTIDSSTIDTNGSAGPPEPSGGGITNSGSLTLTNSIVRDNIGVAGGGIRGTYPGDNTITGSTFTGNSGSKSGGALYNSSEATTITSCTFANNVNTIPGPNQGGGAIFNTYDMDENGQPVQGHLDILDSTLNNNGSAASGFFGGAIFNEAYLRVTYSTVALNNADVGGGIYHRQNPTVLILAYLELDNVTVAYNSALSSGGGALEDPLTVVGSVIVQATIVALNTAPAYPDFQGFLRDPSLISLIPDPDLFSNGSGITDLGSFNGEAVNDIVSSAPQLGNLAMNGGPTSTICPTSGSSPAVDKCPQATTGYLTPSGQDQRGFPEPVDGKGDGTAIRDIGACEFNPSETGSLSGVGGATGAPPDGGSSAGGGAGGAAGGSPSGQTGSGSTAGGCSCDVGGTGSVNPHVAAVCLGICVCVLLRRRRAAGRRFGVD